jgi:hypothetical protein
MFNTILKYRSKKIAGNGHVILLACMHVFLCINADSRVGDAYLLLKFITFFLSTEFP